MILATLASAYVLAMPSNQEARLVLPGIADLPTISGAAPCYPDDLQPADAPERGFDCLQLPLSAANEAAWQYVRLLRERGWRFVGGASVRLDVQRTRDDGTCDGVGVAVMTDFEKLESGTLSPAQEAELPAQLLFFLEADVPCFPET